MDPKKILIVEDDQFIREMYERQIKNAGFVVETASDGKVALSLLEGGSYALVLLDINIPEVNGFEVLKHIKEHDHATKVLVLSNVAGDDNINKAIAAGAQAFIIKSTYTPDQVVDEVKSIIG